MAKRANGEGTLSRRKDESGKTIGWRGAVTVGYADDGTLNRRWVSGKTQAETNEKIRALQVDIHTGMLADTDNLTVKAFMERWTEHKDRDGVKPNTVQSYRDTTKRYITPHIGKVLLEKLRPLDVEHMLTMMRKENKSASMCAYTLRVLKMALRQGVRWQMLPRNAAEAIRPPKVERKELQVWNPGQVATFLDATQAHRMHATFYLALMTGMRRGELLGLKWEDIDFERSRLTVRNNLVEIQGEGVPGKKRKGIATVSSRKASLSTPKTKNSRRTIALSAGTLSKLKEHQTRQSVEQTAAAEAWQGEGFVFANELGGPTNPDALSSWYQKLVKESGVVRIRFHDMRHTAASLMILRGVPPKTVSERLGHADVAFTLRTYTHLYDEQREEAAFDLSDFFPVAQGGAN
jgi:integrase